MWESMAQYLALSRPLRARRPLLRALRRAAIFASGLPFLGCASAEETRVALTAQEMPGLDSGRDAAADVVEREVEPNPGTDTGPIEAGTFEAGPMDGGTLEAGTRE